MGIGLMLFGEEWMKVGGVALFISSWLAARILPDAWSLNGCGTHYYGEVECSTGTVHTKWFCLFFVPILPVQSFYLRDSSGHLEGPDHYSRTLNQSPYPGFGFYWPSVGKTAVWIVPGLVGVCAFFAYFGS